MIIRNGKALGSILHRDLRVQEESSPAEAKPKPPTKAELQAQAEALGVSTEGTKAEIEARIVEAQSELSGPDDEQEVTDDGDDELHG